MKMNTYIKASFPSPNVLSSFMRANPLNRTCRIPWCKCDQFSHLFSFLDMAIKVSTILDKQGGSAVCCSICVFIHCSWHRVICPGCTARAGL